MTNIAWKALCGLTAGLALALAQLAATPAEATDYDIGSIHITKPWAHATPKGAASGAAYMTITNNGKTPDRVTCVSSGASAECQIHTMTMDNGVMKMRPVEGGLEIKPGETVALKPSGVPRGLRCASAPAQYPFASQPVSRTRQKTKPLRGIGHCPALSVPRPRCRPSGAPIIRVSAYPVFATETARRSGPPLCARVDAMSEARQATICCDLSTSRSISRNEREPSSCRPCAKSATL